MNWRTAVLAASRCAAVVVFTADVGEMAVPCFHSVSRLVLAKITALYWLRLLSWFTSSVQSACTPCSDIHLTSAFCTMFAAASGGFLPPASAGPRLAWRGPAVRV